jgi:hypothetical protein
MGAMFATGPATWRDRCNSHHSPLCATLSSDVIADRPKVDQVVPNLAQRRLRQ